MFKFIRLYFAKSTFEFTDEFLPGFPRWDISHEDIWYIIDKNSILNSLMPKGVKPSSVCTSLFTVSYKPYKRYSNSEGYPRYTPITLIITLNKQLIKEGYHED